MLKDRLREVKVLLGRVAPPTSVIRQRIIRRAEVRGGDDDSRPEAPLGVIDTLDLKASSTALPIVEQSSA